METTPFRENCQRCNELQSKLNHQTSESERLQSHIRNHKCWSLSADTEGSMAMDILSTVCLVVAAIAFMVAAHGSTRWSVGGVALAAGIVFRVWGLSFRIL